ncbi:uncharacterized protein LOC117315803 [Pecten maximus]|uniref:uncharacterized protein LOC117315803 n=1 Tax=Pecten maximus TaxID=6579 RepID=UPI001458BBA9|nr:uncharacterized protein LOC117315803 [Pecten maximus]
MEASIKRTALEVMGDIGPREEETSSDTENRNDNDVFRCGKCDLQFQSSYHLHHHIAYTHTGITMETAERLPNPYPVEPLALNLKHSNRVDSPILNKSRDTSPLSKHYLKCSQSVALDLSKPPSNSSEALDLSTTKLHCFREGEVTGYRRSQGEITPSNNPHQNRPYDHTTFEKGYKNDLGKAAADEMVERGQFLVDNPPDVEDLEAGDRLVIDCSNVANYEQNLKDSLVAVTSSQPHGNDAGQVHDNRGKTHGNSQGHHHTIQGQGLQSDNQGQVPSSQSRDLLQGQGPPQGQGLSAGPEAERFNSLSFPFNLQQHMMMMNGGGASPPISNYGMMTSDMQQSLMSFQQQLSPFMKSKPGPCESYKGQPSCEGEDGRSPGRQEQGCCGDI